MAISTKTSKDADGIQTSDETLQRLIGYHLKRAFNVVQADLTQTLKSFELRMLTYSALALIIENPGLRQSQLAVAMDVERPNLVVIVDELEQRELILRERVPTDRRAYALQATLRGQQLFKQADAAVTAHEAVLFQGIDVETRAKIISALKVIRSRGGKVSA
jgi:DNA-binding MarR family transcriptional regulator